MMQLLATANNNITSTTGVSYQYDGRGNRVMKETASETIYYVLGVGEYSSEVGWKRLMILMGGTKVAEYAHSQTYYYHTDHKGSIRFESRNSGRVTEEWDSYPFGETWIYSGFGFGNELHYTGHRRDPETNNDFAGARYYASAAARWLSVDPALGNIANPQRLNRYNYVHNDPINFVDPDGREELGTMHISVVSTAYLPVEMSPPPEPNLFGGYGPVFVEEGFPNGAPFGGGGTGLPNPLEVFYRPLLGFAREMDQQKGLTSCEKMAQIFEWAGNQYNSLLAVDGLLSVLTEFKAFGEILYADGFDSSGFKQIYRDPSNRNQVRHFTMMFFLGFYAQFYQDSSTALTLQVAVNIAAFLRHVYQWDIEDIRLNPVAIAIGVEAGRSGFSDVPRLIRERVCDP